MDENELLTTRELMESVEKEVYIELKKLPLDDPKREKLLKEAKQHSDIRLAEDEAEQSRLQDHARNDIEEARLLIDQQKVENDKARNRIDIGKIIIYLLAGIGVNLASYLLDPWFQKDNRMQKFGEKIHDFLVRR